TTCSIAARNSTARRPWVTSTSPIIPILAAPPDRPFRRQRSPLLRCPAIPNRAAHLRRLAPPVQPKASHHYFALWISPDRRSDVRTAIIARSFAVAETSKAARRADGSDIPHSVERVGSGIRSNAE